MGASKAHSPRFRPGDWVTFQYGVRPVFAQIVEDRGPLGANRRRLYRVRLDWDFNESSDFEMPEDEMEKAVPDKTAILKYLKEGGLIQILSTNLQGGRDQPRVWLTYNSRGELAYTFAADRGLIGTGAVVPFWAIHKDKVFPPKKHAVLDFLSSFGLTREEAESVVETVGTAGPSEVRSLTFR
ncbi:MAG: hypothetical protein ACYC61_19170 [Isosphaeraceae bacterium]